MSSVKFKRGLQVDVPNDDPDSLIVTQPTDNTEYDSIFLGDNQIGTTHVYAGDSETIQGLDYYRPGLVPSGDGSGNKYLSGAGTWVSTSSISNAESITYASLKTLRDGGNLVPGKWYRITDYVTTTTQTNTQSAGHRFDIIVRADSTNKLNENAYAAIHTGDTYFQNSKLESWQLKYCLDNDTNRFAWADNTSGNGKGVIYWMKDEFNNECPYDFKNIQFRFTSDISQSGIVANVYYYTFSVATGTNDATVTDHSLNGSYCHDNKFGQYIYSNKLALPFNVFRNIYSTSYCYSNTFGNNCQFNTFGGSGIFGSSCYNNTFGDSCSYNTFGNYFIDNTFGNECHNNTFGDDCISNTFGQACTSNSLMAGCTYNTFGNECYNNTFGSYCYSNTFDNECGDNTFGNSCGGNTFGFNCQSNTFGNYCQYSIFGTSCNHITFSKDYTYYCTIESGNQCITLTSTQTTSSSNKLRNITIAQGVNNTTTTKTISHNTVNDTFQTVYGIDSSGTLVAWNDADGANMLSKIKSVTYSELVSLRNNSQLVAGQQYRITNYQCTTTQENTQSAGHQFDIVVTADDVNALNENARATKHEGDTYFANCKLESWQLKYSIDNDTNRFAWANDTNGKGVIYYMKDELNNECPYDFKNIQFKRWAVSSVTDPKMTQEALGELNNTFVFDNNSSKFQTRYAYQSSNCTYGTTTHNVDSSNSGWYYTFSTFMRDVTNDVYMINQIEDASIKGNNFYNDDGGGGCFGNLIEPYYNNWASDDDGIDGVQILNNIVFNGYYDNSEEQPYVYHCFKNHISGNSHDNTFGNNCYNNTFGNGCYDNTFGNYFQNNTFGNDYQYNTFGTNCSRNTFGNNCSLNTFGNSCFQNTFGNYCYYNTFGNYCFSNIFGNNCYYNTFGNNCQYNTFGNSCFQNTFGNDCYGNTFGNSCNNITFSKDYTYYCIIENGNQYITLTSTQTTSSSDLLRNITIAQGVNNTTTIKTISHNTVNDTFKTTYQPANSQVISV